jgi:hypothetical protein
MLRSLRWLLVLVAASLAVPASAADVDKYLLNDTDAVLTLNVRQLIDSPLFKKHYLETLRKTIADNKDVHQLIQDLGIDPFKDIDRLLVVHGESSHRLDDKPGGPGKGFPFLIIRGKFNTAKLHAKAEQMAKDYPDRIKIEKNAAGRVYQMAGAEPIYIAVPDSTAIVGSIFKDQVLDALDKGMGKRKTELKFKDVGGLIAKADAKQTLWLVATGRMAHSFDTAEKVINGKKVPITTKDTLANSGVDTVSGGIAVGDGITTELVIGLKDADTSKKVVEDLQMQLTGWVEKAAKLSQEVKQFEPLRVYLLALQIKPDGKTVNIKGDVGAKEFADALK